MNKKEYIERLSKQLNKYCISDTYRILSDYEKIIDEILEDNQGDFNAVIASVGYPEILGDDIASEFGYSLNEEKKVVYAPRRAKSNIIPMIATIFFSLIQVGLVIGIVSVSILSYYFGFSGVVIASAGRQNGYAYAHAAICRSQEKECIIFIAENYKYEGGGRALVDYCGTKSECQAALPNATTYESISIFPALILPVSIMLILVVFNQFLIINRLARYMKDNRDYNRRRYHD